MRLLLIIVSSLVIAAAITLFGVSVYMGISSGMMAGAMGAMALIEPAITALIGVLVGAVGLGLAAIERNTARSAAALEALVRSGAPGAGGLAGADQPAASAAPATPAAPASSAD